GTVDLYTQEIGLRSSARHGKQGFAHAEADLETPGRRAPEQSIQIQRFPALLYAIALPMQFQRAPLALGHAPFAAHEAAHHAALRRVGHVRDQAKKRPSTGEEALAKRLRGMRPAR